MEARTRNGGRSPLAILVLSAASIAAAILLFFTPAFPVSRTFPPRWNIGFLWDEPFWQQVSGYVLLCACGATLFFSRGKRAAASGARCPAERRLRHLWVGLAAAGAFAVHTGLSFGSNLNRLLALNFLALVLLGGLAVVWKIATGKQPGSLSFPGLAHILLFWSLLVLTVFHLLTVYYY